MSSSSKPPSKSTSSSSFSQEFQSSDVPRDPEGQGEDTTESSTQDSDNVLRRPQSDPLRLQRPHRVPAANIDRNQDSPASAPTQSAPSLDAPLPLAGQHPIPPPSEPMQYRAIGLVHGRYQPSEDQFNRGTLITTADDSSIDTVLLGQVMSLVKKYLDLEQPYLWVVYPRTREKEEGLHLQIVGVWSEEGFGPMAAEQDSGQSNHLAGGLVAPLKDGYFSIRGQVVFQDPEKNLVLVKIQQAPRKNTDRPRSFKLKLSGNLASNRTVGYFWDLQVQREGSHLTIQQGSSVGMVPPEKKPKKSRSVPHQRQIQSKWKEKSPSPSATSRKEPRVITKPIKRRSTSSEN